MSAERKQVLEMLAQGKITAEDAERLLDKLNRAGSEGAADGGAARAEGRAAKAEGGGGRGEGTPSPGRCRFLRVVVNSEDGDKVNIRVPLSLVRAGIKLHAVMPEQAREKLEEKGVDLSRLQALDGEELVSALRELHIDVDSSGGDTVRIFCE